jgi:hypothetical protein
MRVIQIHVGLQTSCPFSRAIGQILFSFGKILYKLLFIFLLRFLFIFLLRFLSIRCSNLQYLLASIGGRRYWPLYRRYLVSDTELFTLRLDHSDVRQKFDIGYRIDSSNSNLADIGLIRHLIFRIIDRYHNYHKNYQDSKIGYQISLEMLIRYRR